MPSASCVPACSCGFLCPIFTVDSERLRGLAVVAGKAHVDGDAIKPRRHRLGRALEIGIGIGRNVRRDRAAPGDAAVGFGARVGRLAQRLRRRRELEPALRDEQRARPFVGGRRIAERAAEQAEQRGARRARR